MSKKQIKFAEPGKWNWEVDLISLKDVPKLIRRGQYIRGKYVESFEHSFAQFCGTNYAHSTSNGSDALVLALQACGVSDGDEVIVPAHTFKASIYAVLQVRATPVVVDCNPQGLISAEEINLHISEQTKAIIIVHMHGAVINVDEIRKVLKQRPIYIIEDASQCHGGFFGRRRVGSLGDVAAFSLYPTKNLGAVGDAGIITTNNPTIYQRAVDLSNWVENEYVPSAIPWNRRMDSIQGIFLTNRLRRLDQSNKLRFEQANLYVEYLSEAIESDLIGVLHNPRKTESVYHHFVVLVRERDVVQKILEEKFNIESLVHYRFRLEDVPFRSKIIFSNNRINSMSLRDEILSLPIGRHVNQKSIEYVAKSLIAATQYCSQK